jgi:hypothetical protein
MSTTVFANVNLRPETKGLFFIFFYTYKKIKNNSVGINAKKNLVFWSPGEQQFKIFFSRPKGLRRGVRNDTLISRGDTLVR